MRNKEEEKIKIIKDNLEFSELPIKFQNQIIDDEAKSMLISFDEGVYTKETAKKDAKNYYENHCENKYIYYTSSWRGECVDIKGQETYW